MKKIPAILVLGMHRSGTSMLASILSNAGAYTGPASTQLSGDIYNPKGYYEDHCINEINESIFLLKLKALLAEPEFVQYNRNISNYRNDGWLIAPWLESIEIETTPDIFKSGLKKFLSEWDGKAPIVIKDPRICYTFSDWSEYIDFRAILKIYRHPQSVINSLMNRDKISLSLASDIYCLYNYQVNCIGKSIDSIACNYEKMIADPVQGIERLSEFFMKLTQESQFPEPLDLSAINGKFNHFNKNENRIVGADLNEIYKIHFDKAIESSWSKSNLVEHLPDALLECSHRANSRELDDIRINYLRVLNHPITGSILKLLQRIKSDPSFGKKLP